MKPKSGGLDGASKRNIGLEILEGLRELKRGETGRAVVFPRVSPPNPEIEAVWFEEAERRERAWDAGEVEGIPAKRVMRELRSKPPCER